MQLYKEVRQQLTLSREDLARELGVSYATVNRWENGQTKPSKLARAQAEYEKFNRKRIRQKDRLDGDFEKTVKQVTDGKQSKKT